MVIREAMKQIRDIKDIEKLFYSIPFFYFILFCIILTQFTC